MAAARHPRLYLEHGVPDTLDGRYEMIILHAVLVLDRLKALGEAGELLARSVSEHLFADMDRSLRELGVGDLSVGKKVRRMAEVFYGRAGAYRQAFEGKRRDLLIAALARNVFPGEAAPPGAERLADYAFLNCDRLDEARVEDLLAGRIDFEEPPP
ncbi:MAG: ubiquinol-cytochrome C chaperone family protein [Hyphomicrobiales bacterium]